MEEAFRFVRDNEIFIYLVLGIIAAWFLRKFVLGWRDLREAAFGLERETAQARLNWAASILVFLLILGVVEFALVSYVVPTIPGAAPLFTPTIDLLATSTITLDPNNTPGIPTLPNPTLPPGVSSCTPGQINITSPDNAATVRGVINIIGSANIPNFGFYKYETTPANNPNWLTIQAGNIIVENNVLGPWDTSNLNPGDYYLRLVVTDNAGQSLPPCTIQVRIEAPLEE
ncbi:hypothetical protein ACFLXI_04460 [Chloroflexota bacterium]